MAKLSKEEFSEFVLSTLPDNSSREISALDLRNTFFNLADSVISFLTDEKLVSKNFASVDLRSTIAGDTALARINVAGSLNVDNSAFGYAALEFNYAGIRNTALGSHAASCNALGTDNVALGVHSLGSTTVGSGNLGLGNFSLMGNKFGNFNIAIGHGAGYVAPSDDEFKFYLGVYPQASGDCDDLVDGIDKPPLLYGDLKSLQLAIGASGFRGSEKLAVSGDILPYESGGEFSLGSRDYRWSAHIQDLYVSGNVFKGSESSPFYEYKITDGLSAADTISDGETVAISGISGILTDYSSNVMRVSAAPLSGVLQPQITTNDTRASGLISFNDSRASGLISFNDSRASGLISTVSGNFQDQFNAVSGHAPSIFGPSGLIFHVSGALTEYADSVGAAAGAYTHWKVSDGTKNNNITAPGNAANTLIFGGISGVTTNYRSDTNKLEISAHPLSGFVDFRFEEVSGKLNDISGVNGLVYDASGNLQNQIIAISGENGLIATNDSRASGLIATNDSRASGLISFTSGVLDRFIKTASGNLRSLIFTSGDNLREHTNDSLITAKGFTNDVSGALRGAIADSGYLISGVLDSFIDSVSGRLQSQISTNNSIASGSFNSLSGIAPSIYGPSGLIWNVSGFNRSYTDEQIQDLSLSSDNYAHWKISDGSTIRNIRSLEETQFLGVSGIETETKIAGASGLTISAGPLSGVLQQQVSHNNENASGLISFTSGIAREAVEASGALISGWAHHSFLYYDNRASGLITTNDTRASGLITTNDTRASGLISFTSGVLDRFVKSASGNLLSYSEDLSGVLRGEISDLTADTIGTIDQRIDASKTDIINNHITPLDNTIHSQAGLSGTLQHDIDSVSGYTESLNNLFDTRASGYINNLSGVVIDHDFFAEHGIVHKVSGEVLREIGRRISNFKQDLVAGDTGSWSIGDQTRSNTEDISFKDVLNIVGKDGLETFVGGSEPVYELTVDAGPISGYLEDVALEITGVQGCFQSKINAVSGLININDSRASGLIAFTSGVAREIVGASGALISGWAHHSFLYYDNRASGLSDHLSGILRVGISDSGALISGWAHDSFINYDNRASGLIGFNDSRASGLIGFNDSRASGLIAFTSGVLDRFINLTSGNIDSFIDSVSGNLQDQFTSISGDAPSIFGPSGLIFHVSGASFEHTNKKIQDLALASDAYLNWTISDGTTQRDIRSLEPVAFLGVSGIETQTKIAGTSGIFISANPLQLRASGLISHVSGILHRTVDASGAKILHFVKNDFFTDTVQTEILKKDNDFDLRASGLIAFTSGVLDRYVDLASGNLDSFIDTVSGVLIKTSFAKDSRASGLIAFTSGIAREAVEASGALISGWAHHSFLHYDNRASGLIATNDSRASGLIATNDTRASGYILAVSGATITSAGSGLVRLNGGEFNTAGSGNFERVILNQNGTHPIGQVVADSGREGVTQYHDIVNSSGYLVVPVRSQFEDLKTLNQIDPVNSGAIAFAGGHVRVANGLTWSKPPVVEGFMDEDLDAPTDYSNPTSGKLVTRNELFQASDIYYVINRDHTFAASGGYFLMAMLVNNEYRPVWSTCSGCAS